MADVEEAIVRLECNATLKEMLRPDDESITDCNSDVRGLITAYRAAVARAEKAEALAETLVGALGE